MKLQRLEYPPIERSYSIGLLPEGSCHPFQRVVRAERRKSFGGHVYWLALKDGRVK